MPAKPDPGGRVESRNRSWSVWRTERRAPRWHHRNVDLPARSQIRSRVTSSRSANENYVTARVESGRRILAYQNHFAQRFSSWQCRRRIEFPINSQRLADTEPIVKHHLQRTRVNHLCLCTEVQVQGDARATCKISDLYESRFPCFSQFSQIPVPLVFLLYHPVSFPIFVRKSVEEEIEGKHDATCIGCTV